MIKSLIAVILAISTSIVAETAQPVDFAGAAGMDLSIQGSASQAGTSGTAVAQFAQRYVGYAYTTVGNSPSTGFSCIGFVSYVYQSLGINLPDDLGGAMAFAPSVAFSSLLPGDVLYFQNTVWPGLSHVAIYLGGGRIVHAEWYNRGVVVSSLTGDPVDGDYWSQHYLGANRPWASAPASRPAPPAPPAAAPAPRSVPVAPARRSFSPLPAGPRATVLVPVLNVRTVPSLRGQIVTAIGHGTRVALLGHANGWYRVALRGGTVGWTVGAGIGHGARSVAGASSHRTYVSRSAPKTALRRAQYSGARQTSHVRTIGTVAAQVSGLRLHAAPSLGSGVIGSAGLNQRMGLIGSAGQWTHVQLSNGTTGWVSSLYVRSGAARPAQVSAPARSTSVHRVSTAVNVRVRPSLASPLAGVLAPGRTYQTLGWWNAWMHVRVSTGITGWVSSTVMPQASASGGSATPSRASGSYSHGGSSLAASVRVHSQPSVNSPALAVAYAGTKVSLLATGDTWTKVRLPSGRTGYVLRAYVQN